jgi:hypothetical protein
MKTSRFFFTDTLKAGPKNFSTIRREYFAFFPHKNHTISFYMAMSYVIDMKLIRRVSTHYYTTTGRAVNIVYVLTKKGLEFWKEAHDQDHTAAR